MAGLLSAAHTIVDDENPLALEAGADNHATLAMVLG
jgi:hypothetical protein